MAAGASGPRGVDAFQSLLPPVHKITVVTMRVWDTEPEAAQADAGEQIAQETAVKVSLVSHIDQIQQTEDFALIMLEIETESRRHIWWSHFSLASYVCFLWADVEKAFKLLREKFDNGKWCLQWFSRGRNQSGQIKTFVCCDTPTIVNTFPCQLKALHLQCCILRTNTDT